MVFELHKQADMLELSGAVGEIDLEYLDESGFYIWRVLGYIYYFIPKQKHLKRRKCYSLKLSIIDFLQPLMRFVYGLVHIALLKHSHQFTFTSMGLDQAFPIA